MSGGQVNLGEWAQSVDPSDAEAAVEAAEPWLTPINQTADTLQAFNLPGSGVIENIQEAGSDATQTTETASWIEQNLPIVVIGLLAVAVVVSR